MVHPEQVAASIFTFAGVEPASRSQEMAGQPILMHAWQPSQRSLSTT
jgi:hypothetical protein